MSHEAVQELLDVDDPVSSLLQVVLKYVATPEQAPQPHDTPRARRPRARGAGCDISSKYRRFAWPRAQRSTGPASGSPADDDRRRDDRDVGTRGRKCPGVRLLRRAETVVPRRRHPPDREIRLGRPAATPRYLVKARRTEQLRFRHADVPKLRGAYSSSSPSYEPCSLTPGSAGRDVLTRHCGGSARTRSRRDRGSGPA
jgi:hypothetical protein